MVDLMDPFWVWLAIAAVLAFVVVFMLVRTLEKPRLTWKWFAIFAAVAVLLLVSVLLAVSCIGGARDDGRFARFDNLKTRRMPAP